MPTAVCNQYLIKVMNELAQKMMIKLYMQP